MASAYAAHMARRGCELGLQIDGPVAVDMKRVKARKDAVVAPRQAGLEARDAHPPHRFGADSDNAGRAEAAVTLFPVPIACTGTERGKIEMEDRKIRAALDRHWAASDANDFEAEHQIYREDAVLEYPQSGERIRSTH